MSMILGSTLNTQLSDEKIHKKYYNPCKVWDLEISKQCSPGFEFNSPQNPLEREIIDSKISNFGCGKCIWSSRFGLIGSKVFQSRGSNTVTRTPGSGFYALHTALVAARVVSVLLSAKC